MLPVAPTTSTVRVLSRGDVAHQLLCSASLFIHRSLRVAGFWSRGPLQDPSGGRSVRLLPWPSPAGTRSPRGPAGGVLAGPPDTSERVLPSMASRSREHRAHGRRRRHRRVLEHPPSEDRARAGG